MKFDDEVRKQLDAVVGESYEPRGSWRATLGKWILAAVLAVGTSALIVGILDKYVGEAKIHAAEQAAAQQKVVPVTIVPAQK